jgi:ribosomal protein S28E/S33
MAEGYSDGQLSTALRLLDETGATQNAATIRRLQRERDMARRVAKVLAGPAKHLKILGHDLTADECKAIDAALAYPGREP